MAFDDKGFPHFFAGGPALYREEFAEGLEQPIQVGAEYAAEEMHVKRAGVFLHFPAESEIWVADAVSGQHQNVRGMQVGIIKAPLEDLPQRYVEKVPRQLGGIEAGIVHFQFETPRRREEVDQRDAARILNREDTRGREFRINPGNDGAVFAAESGEFPDVGKFVSQVELAIYFIGELLANGNKSGAIPSERPRKAPQPVKIPGYSVPHTGADNLDQDVAPVPGCRPVHLEQRPRREGHWVESFITGSRNFELRVEEGLHLAPW